VDLSSFQITLISLEILALAFGGMLLGRSFNLPGFKPTGSWQGRLVYWPVEGFDIALLIVLIFLLGIVSQVMMVGILGETIKASVDRKGLEVAVYGFAEKGGGLLGWPVFYLIRRRLFSSFCTPPPASTTPPPILPSWTQALRGGCLTLLTALPLVYIVGFGWHALLSLLGLPSEPQELITIFNDTRSPYVIAGMMVVACILAPLNEEILFRRVLFHFLRQRFGRLIALSVSACLFALLHRSLAGFLPLATFGLMLALAYERTGDIRVPMIAHGLFNLNTIIALLAGLSA